MILLRMLHFNTKCHFISDKQQLILTTILWRVYFLLLGPTNLREKKNHSYFITNWKTKVTIGFTFLRNDVNQINEEKNKNHTTFLSHLIFVWLYTYTCSALNMKWPANVMLILCKNVKCVANFLLKRPNTADSQKNS